MSKVLSFKKSEEEVNFKIFGMMVASGNIEKAARVLRDILKCNLENAQQITAHYKSKFDESPNIIMQTMQIKTFIEQNDQNNALMSIQQIFGVPIPEAIRIFSVMKELIDNEQL